MQEVICEFIRIYRRELVSLIRTMEEESVKSHALSRTEEIIKQS